MLVKNFVGERPYGTGEMQSMQYGAIVGQVNLAHQPPMVSIVTVCYTYFINTLAL